MNTLNASRLGNAPLGPPSSLSTRGMSISARFWRNIGVRQPSTKTEAGVANSTRLKLFCRLFLGLFVGFFCITAALFVRYMSRNQLPQVTVVQSKSTSQPLSGSVPAVPFSSASPYQPTTPSPDAEEKTLIASSASTIVTFIAAAVTNFLSWRKDKAKAIKEKRDASR